MNILPVYYTYTTQNKINNKPNNYRQTRSNVHFGSTVKNPNLTTDRFIQILELGYPKKYTINFIRDKLTRVEQAQTLMDIRLAGFKKRDSLSSFSHKVTNDELEQLIFKKPKKVLKTIKILGKKSFIASFDKKFENVENYIDTIGDISINHPLYQKLLELTNPTESLQYKTRQTQITELKKQFHTINNKDDLIKDINKLTDKNKNLVKESITDYPDKIELAKFFHIMQDSHEILESVLNKYNKKENINELQNILNDIVRTDSNGQVCKQVDFRNNKYLPKMFTSSEGFKAPYKQLLTTINQNPDKSVRETLLELPQNKATKAQFEKYGINFDRWTTFDPKSKLQKNITDNNKQNNIIKNLEEILTSPILGTLSKDKQTKLFDEINSKGYKLNTQISLHNLCSTIIDTNNRALKLYKDNRQISAKELPELVNILSDFMKNDSLWKSPDKNSHATLARNAFESCIQNIKQKILSLNKKPNDNNVQLTVQQIDMNNIPHALFLGNDSSCCTAIGTGMKQAMSPNYIKNKMISGMEILVNDKPIGNTMCYIAKIENKPALVLDNIEIKKDYTKESINNNIRDLMFAYAKNFAKELGKPDMPIYVGQNRNKLNLRNYLLKNKEMKIIGSSGKDRIYIDTITKEGKFDGTNTFSSFLYDIFNHTEKQKVEPPKSTIINLAGM